MNLFEAQAAVTQLYGQYADALHRRDAQDWGATWCSDATWVLPLVDTPDQPLVLEGREAIVGTWSTVMETIKLVQHLPLAPLVKMDAGVVKARWTVQEKLIMGTGEAHEILGIYDDEHREEEGMLRYQKRSFHVLSRRPISADIQSMDHPGKL